MSYSDWAQTKVRASYRLWILRRQMREIESKYEHPDQAVSDPKFYELRDALLECEKEMN